MTTEKLSGPRPELGVVLPLVVVTGLLAVGTEVQALALQLYVLPVVVAGYHFGRAQSLLSAATAIALVSLLEVAVPGAVFAAETVDAVEGSRWLSVGIWGATLLAIAGAVGHLYEAQQRAFDDVRGAYNGVLEIFAKFIDTADRYTEAHSTRVSIYAAEVARRMDLDDVQVEDVRVASLLHDVGKLDIGADVLRKAGKLTESEWQSIRRHPALGAQMVGRAGGLLRSAVPLILYHHERYDGGGYYGLRHTEIPLGARIIAVCDAFDAMTTDRAYRAARSSEEARATIERDAGTHFDPRVVDTFVRALDDRESGFSQVRTHERLRQSSAAATPLPAAAGRPA